MTLATAFGYIEDYVNGDIAYNDSDLVDALYAAAEKGHYTSIDEWNLTVNGKSTDRYDTSILAFCNYWYNEYSDLGFMYKPSYVKAMMGVETKMGTYDGSRHGKTDVMQCLDEDNPCVYCMAKITPSNGVSYSASEGLSYGMKKAGYTAVRNIFDGHTPDYTLVISRLSICFGILWLGYKTAVKGTIKKGIIAYNGGGSDTYYEDVLSCYEDPESYFG